MAGTSGQADGSNKPKAIAQEATDNSSKSDRVASDAVVRRSGVGVGGVGGGDERHGNEWSGTAAGDDTAVSDADTIGSDVGEGKGVAGAVHSGAREGKKGVSGASRVEGKSARGNKSFDVADEAAPTRPSGDDDDGRTSSAKGEDIHGQAGGGGEAGRSRDGVADTAIPGRYPTFSPQEKREGTGGRDGVSQLTTQARVERLPVGSGRRTGEGGAAVSDIAGMPDAAGSTAGEAGTAPDDLPTNPERADTPAAAAAAAAASAAEAQAAAAAASAVSFVHTSRPADVPERIGDRSAAGQRGDAAVGLESSAQAASEPTTQAERAEHTTVDPAAGEALAAVGVGGEEGVNTRGETEADPSDHGDGAGVDSEEKKAGRSSSDAIEPQADENASTPSAGKPPAKSAWGWGLPAWAGGGKNNGAR